MLDLMHLNGGEVTQWLRRGTTDWKVASLNPRSTKTPNYQLLNCIMKIYLL